MRRMTKSSARSGMPFLIPLRGNESDGSRAVVVRVRFLIPLRGNEYEISGLSDVIRGSF